MEPEEGSLRALYASRTEAGGGGQLGPRGCSPPGAEQVCKSPRASVGWDDLFLEECSSHLDSGFGAPFLLLLLLPQL